MKYLLSIILSIFGITAFSQNITVSGFDSSNGFPGKKYVLRPTYYQTPLYSVDDSTAGSHAIDSLKLSGSIVQGRHNGAFYDQFTLPASSAGWALNLNAITAGTDRFGTSNNTSVQFYTNNSLVAWLDSNGRFGIGATAPTARFHVISNNIGVTHTVANSILFENQTAAISGTTQEPPALLFSGNYFNNIGSASQNTTWRIRSDAVQGSNPTPAFHFENSLNGGAYTDVMNLSRASTGQLTLNGYINQVAVGASNVLRDPLILGGTLTNRSLTFTGTNKVQLLQDNTTSDLYFKIGGATPTITSLTLVDSTGKIAIGNNNTVHTSDYSSVLDVQDSSRGSTPYPRLTSLQRDSIGLYIASVTITNGGTGYSGTLTVSVPSATFPYVIAIITATQSGGIINTVTVNKGGFYPRFPGTFTVTGVGSGAVLTPVMAQRITTSMHIYCTDCTAIDGSTGVDEVWNGAIWKRLW